MNRVDKIQNTLEQVLIQSNKVTKALIALDSISELIDTDQRKLLDSSFKKLREDIKDIVEDYAKGQFDPQIHALYDFISEEQNLRSKEIVKQVKEALIKTISLSKQLEGEKLDDLINITTLVNNLLVDSFEKILAKDPEEYLSVRLSDGEKFLNLPSMFASMSGGGGGISSGDSAALRSIAGDFRTQIDYDGGSNPVYIGEAEPGAVSSTASWRIQKLTYSGDSVIEISWANGTDEFDKVWDDRLTYDYDPDS